MYESLREALATGRFAPGQKVTFRYVAGVLDVSLTPVREALRRLVAEGAFEMNPNRSVRVPLMTRDKVLELRDIRSSLEGLAAAKAAQVATRDQIANLRRIAREIMIARNRGDAATDRQKLREFHFAVYAAAGQPTLLRLIEGLWLQTGPYMNLLSGLCLLAAGSRRPAAPDRSAADARFIGRTPRNGERHPPHPFLCRRSRRREWQYRAGRPGDRQ